MMLLGMLCQSTKRTQSSTSEVSKTPAAPYTHHNNDANRYDSLFGDNPTPTFTPSPAQLWLSILEATDNAEAIAPLAEELLKYAWPERNPVDIIGPIGNPHKMFSDTDAAELRIKLRDLLYPEFKSTTP
jgi:hypothetical protein